MRCRECGADNPDEAKACAQCDTWLATTQLPLQRPFVEMALGMVLLILVAAIILLGVWVVHRKREARQGSEDEVSRRLARAATAQVSAIGPRLPSAGRGRQCRLRGGAG